MLERASSCVEPASHILLRRLEPPVRSRRLLGPKFWRNGGDELPVAPWWPLYLSAIRDAPHTRASREPAIPPPQPRQLSDTLHKSPVALIKPSPVRSYTRTSSTHHAGPSTAEAVYDGVGQGSELLHEEAFNGGGGDVYGRQSGARFDEEWADLTALEQTSASPTVAKTAEEQLLSLIGPRSKCTQDHEAFSRAWALFTQISDQASFASRMFHFTSAIKTPERLAHAERIFRLIPHGEKTKLEYDVAIDSLISVDKYSLAKNINQEATSRGLNSDCSQVLLLCCLKAKLWRSGADVWRTSFLPLLRDRPRNSHDLPPERWARISTDPDLSRLLLSLAEVLENQTILLGRELPAIANIARVFWDVAMRSTETLSTLTPEGLLQLFESYHRIKRLNPVTHVTALNTLSKTRVTPNRAGFASMIYRNLRLNFPDFEPSPAVYGTLLGIVSDDSPTPSQILSILDEFAKVHGAPNTQIYQTALAALASLGSIENVHKVFMDLCRDHGAPKDLAFFTPLLYAHARVADVDGTVREFERLRECGLEPNVYCWNILMYAWARAGNIGRVHQVFQDMKASGIAPDRHTIGTIMSVYSGMGDTEGVFQAIEQAQKHGISVSFDMLAGLVHSYCLNDEAETAERLLEAILPAQLDGPAVTVWNYLLRHYAFKSASDDILRIQEKMRKLQVTPDAMTYAALMTSLVVIGKTDDANKLLRTLNLSREVAANAFHYAIVIHGYARENNRDMVEVVVREMSQRYPRYPPSVWLSLLHLHAKQDLNRKGSSFGRLANSLAQILENFSTEDTGSLLPQPGFGRRRAVDALPSIYVEFVTHMLANQGRTKMADLLLQRYESLKVTSSLNAGESKAGSIALLTARMRIETAKRNWKSVNEIWERILRKAIDMSQTQKSRKLDRAPKSDQSQIYNDHNTTTETTTPDQPSTPLPSTGGLLERLEISAFKSMIPTSANITSHLDRSGLQILGSQRHILAGPISTYIAALGLQGQHNKLVELLKKLEQVGFIPTGKNFNFLVQTLTRSTDIQHRTLAFRLFEQKMLPHLPPWKILIRGKSIELKQSGKSTLPRIVDREWRQKQHPTLPLPTYMTVVHLAAVLKSARQAYLVGNKSPMELIQAHATGTVRFLEQMPKRKDRIQGVLLRGTDVKGEERRRIRMRKRVDRSGILGSRLLLDHAPLEELSGAEVAAGELAIDAGERLEGQIPRTPIALEAKNRFETDDETTARVEAKERAMLKVVDQVRRDDSYPRDLVDPIIGVPAPPLPFQESTATTNPKASASGGDLFSPSSRTLEKKGERQMRNRRQLLASISRFLRDSSYRRPEQIASSVWDTQFNPSPRIKLQPIKEEPTPTIEQKLLARRYREDYFVSSRQAQAFTRNKETARLLKQYRMEVFRENQQLQKAAARAKNAAEQAEPQARPEGGFGNDNDEQQDMSESTAPGTHRYNSTGSRWTRKGFGYRVK